ncbi:RHS repeat-associated core domain-containing protein [Actinoplanes friuliensis]|uniref:RHS repeat-containing protein n=1 Tax=Actinoplanes friuliensis DSM 7358 TaxID=1246995 RepID=U5VVN4_9ACTN|nr:RHS repeat-associated core domain-containing protein [Actinoplanes friuliensis]AGZ40934.1 RHS repeat-containing protein [Actinoplanes friuliensis DSM 7358]
MHVRPAYRRSLTAAFLAALLAVNTGQLPARAAPAPLPTTQAPGHAPRADEPGPVNTTPNIGGAPGSARWTPAVTAASTTASSGVRPAAGVAKPGIGMQEWYPVELRQLADRLQLLVNTANGNVMVRYNDLKISGIGFGTDLSHVYNNLSEGSGSFGRGWTMSTGKDVGLEISSDKIVLHGPTAFTSTFTKSSSGTYKAGSGINAALTKKSDGQYELKWDDSEDVWTFHSNGSLREMKNNNDLEIKLNYDSAYDDRLAAIYDPNGRVTTMSEYDSANRIVRMTDWTGGVHGPFAYDSSGNLTNFPDRLGNQIRFGYDSSGNLTSIVDPRGSTYTLEYDSSRRVKKISEPTGSTPAVTEFGYPESRKTTEKDPRGNTSTYKFDSDGRQTKATDPLGHEQDKEWTANSDVASTTNGLGASVTYGFDGANNPTSAKLPTGAKSVAGYTDATHPAFPTSMTDPQGKEVKHTYGANGDLLSVESQEGEREKYDFDHNSRGQVTRMEDPEGFITTYQYDGAGRLTTEFPPGALQERGFTYDDRDRIVETRDGNDQKIHYRYDALDRLIEIQRVDGTTYVPIQHNTYDANGNLKSRSHADTFVEFVYNPRNQVTEARNTRSGVRYNVYYRYDLNNNLTDIEDDGGRVKYEYDKANRLEYQSGPKSGMWAEFEYDDADRRTDTRFASEFKIKADYDDSGRQTSLVATRPDGSKPIDRSYKWDDADGDTSLMQSEKREGGTTINYEYDDRNRLTKAGSHTYDMDKASNLEAAEGRTFTINSAGQVATSAGVTYTHDGNGNLTTGTAGELTAAYSPTNQLTSLATKNAETIGITYDTTDQTQRAVIRTGTREQVLTNTAIGVTGVTTNGARSLFVRDSGGGLIGQFTEAGEPLYAVTDYQGSTLLLVDANHAEAAKYTYKPYGTTEKTGRAAAGNPFRWNGHWQLDDAHGTYLVGHRQHDPKLARWTQPDPSGQELNRYTYGAANPVTNTDPTGLATSAGIEICIAVCLGAGWSWDDYGNHGLYTSNGFGLGIGIPVQATDQEGPLQTGQTTNASCSAGPFGTSVSEDAQGNETWGTAEQGGIGCSFGTQYQW